MAFNRLVGLQKGRNGRFEKSIVPTGFSTGNNYGANLPYFKELAQSTLLARVRPGYGCRLEPPRRP